MRKITIDLAAIASNYKVLKKLTGVKVMAIVKADAFGHGIVEVSRKLDSIKVDMLGTADLDEALQLRQAGIKAPIMAWLHSRHTNFEPAVINDIQIGVSTPETLDSVAKAAVGCKTKANIHLKVDTGLGRNGSTLETWPALVAKAVELEKQQLVKLVGVFSHLSGTSEQDDLDQLAVFQKAIEDALSLGAEFEIRHLAASNASLSLEQTHLDMVRVGLALYGQDPSKQIRARDFGLIPAMRVSSEVALVKKVPAGSGVSYGYLHRTDGETNLVLVPFGYAEGLPRLATGKAEVSLNGKKYKILARIAMDQFVLDIGNDTAVLGDEVVIFGDEQRGEPTAHDLAEAAGTINYEIITRIGGRAKREFIG